VKSAAMKIQRTFTLIVAVALVGPSPVARAQEKPIIDAERTFLVSQFERTLGVFDAGVKGVSEAQSKFKEGPERWSILEIAEHLAVIEDFLFGYATGPVLKSPAKPELGARTAEEIKAADERMLVSVVDRSKKGQAPEQAKPTGRYATLAAASTAFHEKRAKVIEYAKTTQDPLRAHGTANPAGRLSDVYQYLLMLSAHTERHVLQMLEVKAASGYPSN